MKDHTMTYLLFSGSDYYPAGGADDFAGAFASIADAKAYFAEHPQEWAHIARFDGERLTIVCAYGTACPPGRPEVTAWHDCTDT